MEKVARRQLLIQMIWLVLVDSRTWPNPGTCVLIWNLERNKGGQISRSCQSFNLHFDALPKRTADDIKTCVGGTWSGSSGSPRDSGSEVIRTHLHQRAGKNPINGRASRPKPVKRQTKRKSFRQANLHRQTYREEMRQMALRLKQIWQHSARLLAQRRRENRRRMNRERKEQRQMEEHIRRQGFRQAEGKENSISQGMRQRQRVRQTSSEDTREIYRNRQNDKQIINQLPVNRPINKQGSRQTLSSKTPSLQTKDKLHVTLSNSGQQNVTEDICLLKTVLSTCGFYADFISTPAVVIHKDWILHSISRRPQQTLKESFDGNNNRKQTNPSTCHRSVLQHLDQTKPSQSSCACPGGSVHQVVTSQASSVTATIRLQSGPVQSISSTTKIDTGTVIQPTSPRGIESNLKRNISTIGKTLSEIKLPVTAKPQLRSPVTPRVDKTSWQRKISSTAKPLVKIKSPVTTRPQPGRLEFDYYDALEKSMMFYFAQRSGPIYDRIIPWRTHHSAMRDGSDVGRDLVGGWYDAGDHVKFNFPMAASTTILLWGFLKWGASYQAIGKTNMMYMLVKHPLDYFLKCWDSKNKMLYAQVGDAHIDHFVWGRPEDMKTPRPTFYLNVTRGGSDLAAEMAAALAAGSMAFRAKDPSFSSKLLKAAEEIYEFADSVRDKYDINIPRAADFYKSVSGFYDELCWGAAWLLRATGKEIYRSKARIAMRLMDQDPVEFSWDSKSVGCYALMYKLAPVTEQNFYRAKIINFMNDWVNFKGLVKKTPCGLAWLEKWGSLRYAANTALIGLLAADDGINPLTYRTWAEKQIKYILGANSHGFSFQVGFGNHFPLKPHHPAASCPLRPAPCDWETFKSPAPNPNELTGALVGGPGRNDDYVDLRTDFVRNEVTTDYNAGFQSALAGLINLHRTNQLPNAKPQCRNRQNG